MLHASITVFVGTIFLTSSLAAPGGESSNAYKHRIVQQMKQSAQTDTPRKKDAKPRFELQHPVYKGEKIIYHHPIWDGSRPTLVLINSGRQSTTNGGVLGTMYKESPLTLSTQKAGGADNGTYKK